MVITSLSSNSNLTLFCLSVEYAMARGTWFNNYDFFAYLLYLSDYYYCIKILIL